MPAAGCLPPVAVLALERHGVAELHVSAAAAAAELGGGRGGASGGGAGSEPTRFGSFRPTRQPWAALLPFRRHSCCAGVDRGTSAARFASKSPPHSSVSSKSAAFTTAAVVAASAFASVSASSLYLPASPSRSSRGCRRVDVVTVLPQGGLLAGQLGRRRRQRRGRSRGASAARRPPWRCCPPRRPCRGRAAAGGQGRFARGAS